MSIRHNRLNSLHRNSVQFSKTAQIPSFSHPFSNNPPHKTSLIDQKYSTLTPTLQNKQNQHKQMNISSLSLQYQILCEKMKKIEAMLANYEATNIQLQKQNQNLVQINQKQSQLIETLNLQAKSQQKKLINLTQDLQARKKSSEQTIRECRGELTQVKVKNQKLLDIIKYLELKVESFESKEKVNRVAEADYKMRLEQQTKDNEEIRRRMAKAEVQSEKYKLKALQGEKFWSNKLDMQKVKKQEEFTNQQTEKLLRHQQQLGILHVEIERLTKINKIKQKQINSLEKRLYDIVHEKSNI